MLLYCVAAALQTLDVEVSTERAVWCEGRARGRELEL